MALVALLWPGKLAGPAGAGGVLAHIRITLQDRVDTESKGQYGYDAHPGFTPAMRVVGLCNGAFLVLTWLQEYYHVA